MKLPYVPEHLQHQISQIKYLQCTDQNLFLLTNCAVEMVGELKLPWLQDMPWEEFEKLFSNHGILKMMDGYDPALTKTE